MTNDQKASTAAKTLYEGFISIFGPLKRILTNQGKAFPSEAVEQLRSQFGISQSTTTAYHPQGNGHAEGAHPDSWKDDREAGGQVQRTVA